ncbi:MAG: hypothetical protein ACPIOQ_10345 [Promethearchaeia archaeon]
MDSSLLDYEPASASGLASEPSCRKAAPPEPLGSFTRTSQRARAPAVSPDDVREGTGVLAGLSSLLKLNQHASLAPRGATSEDSIFFVGVEGSAGGEVLQEAAGAESTRALHEKLPLPHKLRPCAGRRGDTSLLSFAGNANFVGTVQTSQATVSSSMMSHVYV